MKELDTVENFYPKNAIFQDGEDRIERVNGNWRILS